MARVALVGSRGAACCADASGYQRAPFHSLGIGTRCNWSDRHLFSHGAITSGRLDLSQVPVLITRLRRCLPRCVSPLRLPDSIFNTPSLHLQLRSAYFVLQARPPFICSLICDSRKLLSVIHRILYSRFCCLNCLNLGKIALLTLFVLFFTQKIFLIWSQVCHMYEIYKQ